ncbi:MAG: glutamate--tRNA ligase [Acidimicrobiia bacterium]
MNQVRARFSPAPTGFLHVGSARTALFNWLFARHQGGFFLLRIEDTDAERSSAESAAAIQSSLQWLGLDWDEPAMLQSDRLDRYHAAAGRLLDGGLAYECYCTEEEVRIRGAEARAAGRPPGYDGRCRDLTPDARAQLRAEGRPRSIRFRTPDEGTSTFHDQIRGEVSVEWLQIPDFVIVRSGGRPLFFLANAVDDIDTAITHVIRGEDLLDSTHRVLALRRALSPAPTPAYAHLPLIVGPDRAKLSKRHGAVAVEELRDEGFLPEAVLNYLSLLGWSPEDGREVMTRDELVSAFDLDNVTHAAAGFDHDKLSWMNGEHLRALPTAELVDRIRPLARARFGADIEDRVLAEAVALGQERSETLAKLVDQMGFLFVPDSEFVIEPDSWERLTSADQAREVLDAAIGHLESCGWTVNAIDLRPALEPLGLKPRKVLPAVYTAVEGRHAGLPLFDSIYLLGRDRSLHRLRAALARLEKS